MSPNLMSGIYIAVKKGDYQVLKHTAPTLESVISSRNLGSF